MNIVKLSVLFAVMALAVSPTAHGMNFFSNPEPTFTQKVTNAIAKHPVITGGALLTTAGTIGAGSAYLYHRRKAKSTPVKPQEDKPVEQKKQEPASAPQESLLTKVRNGTSTLLTSATEYATKFSAAHPRLVKAGKYTGAGLGVVAAGSTVYCCRGGLATAAQNAASTISEHKAGLIKTGAGIGTAAALGGTVLVAKKKGLLSKKTPKQQFMQLIHEIAKETDQKKAAEHEKALQYLLVSRNDAGLTQAINNEFTPALRAYRDAVHAQKQNTAEDKKAEFKKAVEQAQANLNEAIGVIEAVVRFAPIF